MSKRKNLVGIKLKTRKYKDYLTISVGDKVFDIFETLECSNTLRPKDLKDKLIPVIEELNTHLVTKTPSTIEKRHKKCKIDTEPNSFNNELPNLQETIELDPFSTVIEDPCITPYEDSTPICIIHGLEDSPEEMIDKINDFYYEGDKERWLNDWRCYISTLFHKDWTVDVYINTARFTRISDGITYKIQYSYVTDKYKLLINDRFQVFSNSDEIELINIVELIYANSNPKSMEECCN